MKKKKPAAKKPTKPATKGSVAKPTGESIAEQSASETEAQPAPTENSAPELSAGDRQPAGDPTTEPDFYEDPTDDTPSLTFWGHLEELRWSLMRVAVVMLVLMIGCFMAMPYLFDNFVLAPTTSDFPLYRLLGSLGSGGSFLPDFSGEFKVDLININVASQFMTHISTSFWFALVLAFPYLIFEIWKFIQPALFVHERKSLGLALFSGTLLFFMGCTIGYCIVFPFTFRFLVEYQISTLIVNQISLTSYMGNFMMLIFLMGLVFELPLLAWVLSQLGLITRSMMVQYRKHAVVVLLILSALITPSGDPFTLMIVFLPLYLLYEVGLRFVKR